LKLELLPAGWRGSTASSIAAPQTLWASIADWLARGFCSRLLAAGIKIRHYRRAMLAPL
jgi:hypothetical protein